MTATSATSTVSLRAAAPVASASIAAASPKPIRTPRAEVPPHRDAVGASEVRINDRLVFLIRNAQGSRPAEERARAASEALEREAAEQKETEVHVEEGDAVAVVYAGKTPIVQLTIEDARAAGDSSIAVHAAAVSASIDNALRSERRRSAIANAVFSFSLLVFSGLIAFLVMKKIGEVTERLRRWMSINPTRLKPLRFGGVEVVSSAAMRGGFSVAIGISRRVLQFGVLYLWLVVGLSLFESTRGHTERLTGFVLTPLSNLIGRVGTTLPLLIVGAIAAAAVTALVRFVALFFGSVARGETSLRWLPRDLAEPTSILLRAGIILSALIFVVPLITASAAAESQVGIAILGAFVLASVPILACAPIGIVAIFARRLHVGDFVEIGGKSGRITALTLLEVRLEDDLGVEVRVPHLFALVHPVRVNGPDRLIVVRIAVDPRAKSTAVEHLLFEAARDQAASLDPRVELADLNQDGAIYRVSIRSRERAARSALLASIAERLQAANVALGRDRSGAASARSGELST
jgi:small-conductance mechanosensitive channel